MKIETYTLHIATLQSLPLQGLCFSISLCLYGGTLSLCVLSHFPCLLDLFVNDLHMSSVDRNPPIYTDLLIQNVHIHAHLHTHTYTHKQWSMLSMYGSTLQLRRSNAYVHAHLRFTKGQRVGLLVMLEWCNRPSIVGICLGCLCTASGPDGALLTF